MVFKIICNITSSPAPGIPSKPTKIEVIILRPIWKPKFAPIILIINIKTPPNIEFNISLNTLLNGKTNILPNINKKIIHAKKVITLLKSKYNHPFTFILWLHLDKYYCALLFFIYISFTISKAIPLFLAFFIK